MSEIELLLGFLMRCC